MCLLHWCYTAISSPQYLFLMGCVLLSPFQSHVLFLCYLLYKNATYHSFLSLQEVIELTLQLLNIGPNAGNPETEDGESGIVPATTEDEATDNFQTTWSPGDSCLAIWSDDGQLVLLHLSLNYSFVIFNHCYTFLPAFFFLLLITIEATIETLNLNLCTLSLFMLA